LIRPLLAGFDPPGDILLAASLSGCVSTSKYLVDRGLDAADVFTGTVGMGFGAKARVGPLQAGALYNIDMWGARNGEWAGLPWYEVCTRDGLFPFPARWIGYYEQESGRFGDERFAHDCEDATSWERGKDFVAHAPLPFLGVSKQPAYYTQIDIVVGVFGSLRLGFNPGELLDFIVGWTTLDIYGDDLGKENRTTPRTLRRVPCRK
jgi:hypothetical protein